jgi:transposase
MPNVLTKVHLRVDANSNVISIILTPGQQHESAAFKDLIDRGTVKRNRRGRPKKRPRRIERLIGRVKFRRIATRYEKRAANYLPMWYIGIILLWLQV